MKRPGNNYVGTGAFFRQSREKLDSGIAAVTEAH